MPKRQLRLRFRNQFNHKRRFRLERTIRHQVLQNSREEAQRLNQKLTRAKMIDYRRKELILDWHNSFQKYLKETKYESR